MILPIDQHRHSESDFLCRLHFTIVIFNQLLNVIFLIPLLRLIYQALGARMGRNSYCAGFMYEPSLVTIGDDTLIGHGALIVPHLLDGRGRAYFPVRIGSGVTIGPHAVIMPGVTIGDGSIIEAGAVVPRGTTVGAGEVWVGPVARPLTLADLKLRALAGRAPPRAISTTPPEPALK